jgi:hypothetical protein
MLISTDRGAAEIVSTDEETRFYDDIGCLAADWDAHQSNARSFVRVADGRWVDARDASFAQPTDERTAMGSGVVAFAAADEARAVDRAGRALTFSDLVQRRGAKQ